MAVKTMKPLLALRNYFYDKESGQSLQEFASEVKQLSGEEKRELAALACEDMGVTLIEA